MLHNSDSFYVWHQHTGLLPDLHVNVLFRSFSNEIGAVLCSNSIKLACNLSCNLPRYLEKRHLLQVAESMLYDATSICNKG